MHLFLNILPILVFSTSSVLHKVIKHVILAASISVALEISLIVEGISHWPVIQPHALIASSCNYMINIWVWVFIALFFARSILKNDFIYLFLAVLGRRWCAGFSLVVISGATRCCDFSCCGACALEPEGFSTVVPGLWRSGTTVVAHRLSCMWDLPGSGIKLVSPALAGRFFTTELPGKPAQSICSPIFSYPFVLRIRSQLLWPIYQAL